MSDIATLKTLGQTAIPRLISALVAFDYTHPVA